jgi:branched-chain amino acid transport system permease protein
MVELAQYAVGGLAAGTLYGLVALGIVLLYRSSRVLNFAHGDLGALAAFVAFTFLVRLEWPFLPAVASSLAVAAALGVAFYFFVLRPAREATLLGRIVVTLGLALAVNGAITLVWGADTKVFPFPLSDIRVYRIGSVVVSQMSLGLSAVGLLLMVLLYLLVQRTKIGLAMRAVSQDLVAAQALGIPSRRIFALTWGLAGALGAAAGILTAGVLVLVAVPSPSRGQDGKDGEEIVAPSDQEIGRYTGYTRPGNPADELKDDGTIVPVNYEKIEGAIGGTIGAHLIRAGHTVTFVDAAEDHVRAINARGLTIEGTTGSFTVRAPAITPTELRGPLGMVFLAVKTMHTDIAAREIGPHLAPGGAVVSMQSFVHKDIDPGIFAGGKPAEMIKKLDGLV